jgi:hypothetical protein
MIHIKMFIHKVKKSLLVAEYKFGKLANKIF